MTITIAIKIGLVGNIPKTNPIFLIFFCTFIRQFVDFHIQTQDQVQIHHQ